MCGIVGVLGTPSGVLDKMFKELLQVDVVRGWDSTGAFSVASKSKIKIAKAALLPQDLMEEQKFKEMIFRQNFLMVGHNRKATKGDITDDNAHPFRHGHITLVHNGNLHSQYGLPDADQFQTDSESLCHHINKMGIDEVWPCVGGGAAALLWWNSNDKTLNLLRNKERPLCFAFRRLDRGLVIASEPWMIRAIAERNKVELLAEDDEDVFEPAPHHLFSFKWDGKTTSFTTREVESTRTYHYHAAEAKPKQLPFRQQSPANKNSTSSGDGTEAASNRCIEDHLDNVLSPRGLCDLPPWMGQGSIEELVAEWYEKSAHLKEKSKLTEELFHKKYPKCCSCDQPLTGEYDSSVVIDERKALCNGCTLTAAMNDMDINAMSFVH